MAHDGAGNCTSDCRRIGCPDDEEETDTDRGLQINGRDQKITTEHLDNCAGCPLCEI